MAAMQNLPYPLMVLDNQKTLVMANEALGRLLDIQDYEGATGEETAIVEKLQGKTPSQLGIDVLQDGRPTWITWDGVLDAVAREMDNETESHTLLEPSEGDTGSPAKYVSRRLGSRTRTSIRDTVVEVSISPAAISTSYSEDRGLKAAPLSHTYAKLIITVWGLAEERSFILTFTNTETSLPSSRTPGSRPGKKYSRESTESPSEYGSSAHLKYASFHKGSSILSAITSPTNMFTPASPFPRPSPTHLHSTSSEKLFVIKDALLDSTETPILAMWKDFGLTISNKAARQMLHLDENLSAVTSGSDLVMKWQAWDEAFTAPLKAEEYPIIQLIRTEKPFTSRKVGIKDNTGCKHILDFSGEAIRDEITGEFLAGIVTAKNITEEIREIKAKNEQYFQLICNSMPQIIWTSTSEGVAEWFSERW
jgi:PAS domain-containing protein